MSVRVLVADMQNDTTMLLEQQRPSQAFDIKHVTSGRAMVRTLRRGSFDLLILDARLEDMPGPSAAGVARELQPDVKIIMTTAKSSPALERRCRQVGLVYYGIKPVEPKVMLGVIETALKGISVSFDSTTV